MNYFIDGDLIRFDFEDRSGYFHKDYECEQSVAYLAWVAEGNTAEEWQPDAVEPETTQPDMEEEV